VQEVWWGKKKKTPFLRRGRPIPTGPLLQKSRTLRKNEGCPPRQNEEEREKKGESLPNQKESEAREQKGGLPYGIGSGPETTGKKKKKNPTVG